MQSWPRMLFATLMAFQPWTFYPPLFPPSLFPPLLLPRPPPRPPPLHSRYPRRLLLRHRFPALFRFVSLSAATRAQSSTEQASACSQARAKRE